MCKKIKCAICGKEFAEDELIQVQNGKMICPDCIDENYIQCDNCGVYVEKDKITKVQNGEYVCNDCIDNYYAVCDDCGEYVPEDELTATGNRNYVCQNCLEEDYSQCDDCKEYYLNDDLYETGNGNYVCQNCLDEDYSQCEGCEEYYPNDTMSTTEDGYLLCEDCWENDTYYCEDRDEIYYSEENYKECLNKAIIKDYSFKPKPKFKGNAQYYFGTELEIGKILDDYDKEDLAKEVIDKLDDIVYLKNDGSLDNGFEIVTHPLSFDYIKSHNIFEKIEETLKGKARAYNKGGMHIHISRDAFKTNNHLHKFLYFLHEYKDFSKFIAQRNSTRWAGWYEKEELNDFTIYSRNNGRNDRYMAVNFENYYTIELRIFNSNLITNRNYKNVEFLHSVIEFTKVTNDFCFYDYWKFVNNHKDIYNNLIEFCNRNTFNRIFENLKEKTIKLSTPEKILPNWDKLQHCIIDLPKEEQKAWKKFFNWLKEKNIFNLWKDNLNSYNTIKIKNLAKDLYEGINYAFKWDKTEEGQNFWQNYCCKWNDYYNINFSN